MSTEDLNSYSDPQSTGSPDAVETDPAGLNSAEDLDEDRIRKDPLESGMDPPEQWSGVTKYGMTPWEESHARPLADRLAEEQPDVPVDQPPGEPVSQGDGVISRDAEDEREARIRTEAEQRGQAADDS